MDETALLLLVLSMASSFLFSLLCCALIIMSGPRDAPDGVRKLQARAVPSSGGIGILLGAIILPLFWFVPVMWHQFNTDGTIFDHAVLPHVLLVLGMFLLGFIDDMRPLPARLKLVVMLALCAFAATFGFRLGAFNLPGYTRLDIPLLSIVLSMIWLIVIINAANFVDGVNGLMAGSFAIALIGMAILFFATRDLPTVDIVGGLVALIFVPAIIAFLVLNLAGKLFAGDSGSLGLGALYGALGLFWFAPRAFDASLIIVPAAFILPILIDVIATLIWRAWHRKNLFTAHRDHAYQLCLRAGWPWLGVTLLWWFFSVLCCALMLSAVFAIPPFNFVGKEGFAGMLARTFTAFALLLIPGGALWIWQRVTLERKLNTPG